MATNNLLTGKQEAFAQGVVSGLTLTDAYKQAGYAYQDWLDLSVWQAASKLAADTKVHARIGQLRSAQQERFLEHRAWNLDKYIAENETNLAGARNDRQWASANGALQEIGETLGLRSANRSNDGDVRITKVTVVLNRGSADQPSLGDTTVVESSSRLLESATLEPSDATESVDSLDS